MRNLEELIESSHNFFGVSVSELRQIVEEGQSSVINGGQLQAFDIQRCPQDDGAFNVSYSFNGWSYHSITLYLNR